MARSDGYFTHFCILFTLVLTVQGRAYSETCAGLWTKGYTVPRGDIIIEYENPLDIYCVLNDKKYIASKGGNASSAIYFIHNYNRLPDGMVDIVNGTVAHLHVEKPPISHSTYSCMLDNETVCLNQVFVGVKPQPVTDFKCISYNYENLVCSWTAPNNNLLTHYDLTYTLSGRASRLNKIKCAIMTEPVNGLAGNMSCKWNMTTDPQYRLAHERFTFTLTAKNVFGEWSQNTTFNHFQNVLPNPPINLTAISKTPNSLLLYWEIPLGVQTFPKGLQHRILYTCDECGSWILATIIRNNKRQPRTMKYNLTGLPYAHYLYDIRVAMASNITTDERMWSNNASITPRTGSKRPEVAPRTTPGCFEIMSVNNDIQRYHAFVYWQLVPNKLQNGPDFHYNVSLQGGGNISVDYFKAYAKINNLWKSKSYTFIIRSNNSVGPSHAYSTVHIPPQTGRIRTPIEFTKIAHDNNVYELTWEKPNNINVSVTNYTIFWCNYIRDRPYQCAGNLTWQILPAEATHTFVNVYTSDIYQFAISANTAEGSSGMTWAACTLLPNQNEGKLKTVWIPTVGPTFIEVSWKLDCSDHIGSVTGYIIYYCPIVSPTQSSCKADQKNVTLQGGSSRFMANVTDLTPYTTYMLTVAVLTRHKGYSQQSDPVFNTTLEAAPSSEPQNLTLAKVTSTSITVTWDPPSAINGVLRYYEVNIRSKTMERSQRINGGENSTQYTFEGLPGYEVFTINVLACTIACSSPSLPLNVRTKIGYPSKIDQAVLTSLEQDNVVVNWKEPAIPAGKNDFYQVFLSEQHLLGDNNASDIFNVTERKYVVQECKTKKYISIRAVNIANGTLFHGPWSDETEVYCGNATKFVIWILSTIIILIIVGFILLAKRAYTRYRTMKEVEVVLPKGLEMTKPGWDLTTKHQPEPENRPPADEELLLDKISETKHHSGDSSGCSSAHDSVTSSIDSGSHISSTSDSGTEHPRSPSGELRQRAISTPRLSLKDCNYTTTDNVSTQAWAAKNSPPASYCVLGVDPTLPTDDPTSVLPDGKTILYISCDTAPVSAPYVVTGDMKEPEDHIYVPYVNREQLEKSTAYVIAGSKAHLMPDLLQQDCPKLPEKSYVQVAEVPGGFNKFNDAHAWSQPPLQTSVNKSGYVSIGDAGATQPVAEHGVKGYVPHRHFEGKALKED